MKKIIFYICVVAIVAVAAVNVSLAFKSDASFDLTLVSVVSLARGEGDSDQKAWLGTITCDNGKTLKGVVCINGNEDCTPEIDLKHCN